MRVQSRAARAEIFSRASSVIPRFFVDAESLRVYRPSWRSPGWAQETLVNLRPIF
jgi:hypothetical protein